MVMRRVMDGWEGGFKIGGLNISNLRYADDIVLIATSVEELQELVCRLVRECHSYNLHVNSSKTKVMTNCEDKISIIIIEGFTEPLEQVTTFQYLGAGISAEADCRADIRKRLAKASSTLANLKIRFKSGAISNSLKWRLVKVLV